ncbi:hypothetical protein QLL95_gp0121 [Cotonvirus japonicus]|uniref:C2 domain-containing protein n=1 Tax=Cotonvirus japonicus TaxID=2811091 RepID=A0ABM7NR32_9VIRU|nr:hypothetical protein QLL95_gp0121 [Cotonvirus japonicus]BCS82610.1 hypothetical protein [Cotonvirus japonicus]
MDELISFDRNQRLKLILNNIKKLDHNDLHKIKKAILQQEFELDFDDYVPCVFKTKIKDIMYKSSYTNPVWNNNVKCKFKIEFDNNCNIDLCYEYKKSDTCHYGETLKYTDVDDNRLININIGKKSYTIGFNAKYDQTNFTMNNKALKLLDALSIKKNDLNKKNLGILIYNMVGQAKPEDYDGTIDIMQCNDFNNIMFIYEP